MIGVVDVKTETKGTIPCDVFWFSSKWGLLTTEHRQK
jgi:hypothetical protein